MAASYFLRVETVDFVFPASSGEYVPVLVDHSDELPCRGQYYLHHGLQRRIRITLVHTATPELKWKDVRELVVGRIRQVDNTHGINNAINVTKSCNSYQA